MLLGSIGSKTACKHFDEIDPRNELDPDEIRKK